MKNVCVSSSDDNSLLCRFACDSPSQSCAFSLYVPLPLRFSSPVFLRLVLFTALPVSGASAADACTVVGSTTTTHLYVYLAATIFPAATTITATNILPFLRCCLTSYFLLLLCSVRFSTKHDVCIHVYLPLSWACSHACLRTIM